jgi:precorrin-2 dehydrogenase/sirohydrochlorin ferrochelatase
MRYYPVNLDIQNKGCLVVGGGRIGERKVGTLVGCGAKVTVIAPEATEHLKALASDRLIHVELRAYETSDQDGKFLVIGATNDEELNQRISRDAAKRGTLCNIVDRPEACTFVLPAIIQQGDLVIAISTSNKSPALAKRVRQTLEKEFGPEYTVLLNLMGAIRQRLLSEARSTEARQMMFERLLDEGLLEMIREDRTQDIDTLLKDVLGEEYKREELMKADQVPDRLGYL